MPVINPPAVTAGVGFTVDVDGYISFTGSTMLPFKVVSEDLGGGSYRVRLLTKHPVLGQIDHTISQHP